MMDAWEKVGAAVLIVMALFTVYVAFVLLPVMNAWEKVGVAVFIVMAAFCAYIIFVLMPVMFYANAECLRAGYPKAQVTIGLERYCTTLDGAVTVRVTKQ